jgi:hypothetical protein
MTGKFRQIAAGAGIAVAAVIAVAPAASAASPTQTINIQNDTGGHIASLTGQIKFLSKNKFTITGTLSDTLCDARSVAATVTDSNGELWENGVLGGLPYTWKNSLGCGHSEGVSGTFTDASAIQRVTIYLFAGNNNGDSSTVSATYTNPYY